MKNQSTYSLIIFIFTSLIAFGEGVPELNYKIVSDTVISSVPEGKCLIHGVITIEKESLEECKVATEDHKFSGISNSKGEYQFLIDVQNIRLYAFQVGLNEVVTEKYDFKSRHSVHIDFFMEMSPEAMPINLKPVIYAYSDKEIEAKIEMDLVGDLTFSYPEYGKAWDVIVIKEGLSLQEDKNKVYPYLFWEGETPGLDFQSSNTSFNGVQINTDSTIQFLETKCELFGFNPVETTDFITFWAPRIMQYNFAKIEFLVDDEYDVVGKLKVTPKPDNMRRIYILFQGMDECHLEIQRSPTEVEPMSRKGFTIVEWGGTELAPTKKLNP